MNQEDVDRKLAEMGYEHPSENNSTNNPYKVYQEKGDNPYTSFSGGGYATFNSKSLTDNSLDVCPVCDTKAMYMCDCEMDDRMCKNGHVWYCDKNGKIIQKDPHGDS